MTNDEDARRMLVHLLARPGDNPIEGAPLSRSDALFLITTCAGVMIQVALCETADYRAMRALKGLDALMSDMRQQIIERCARRMN